jgi:hypothetical protein
MDLNGKPLTTKRVVLLIVGVGIAIPIFVFHGGMPDGIIDVLILGFAFTIALHGWDEDMFKTTKPPH